MLIMDHMDIDQVLDVPDTPDRLAAQNITERSGLEKQNSSFKFGHFGQGNLFSEERKNCLKNCDRAQIHPPRGFSRPGKSGHHVNSVVFDSGDSSSSRNGPIFRKKVADKGLNYENKDSDHLPYIHNRKSFLTSQSSAGRDSAVVDLTDHNGRAPLLKKAFPSRAPGVTRAELADGYSSYSTEDSPLILKEGNEGRQLNNADKVDSSLDCVKQDDNNNAAQPNAQRNDSVILNSISVPRATRQKRLVRNGCISPLNIAKGKQPVEKDNSGSTGMRQSDSVPVASNASTSLIDFRDIVAEDYNSRSSKGKGLLNHPLSMNGRSTHKPSRNSLSINEKASESGDASRDGVRNFEESSGWRTTHTQSRKLNPPVSRQGQHISIEDSGSSFVSRCNGNTVMRREHEDNARRIHENSNGQISDASAPFSNTRGCHMAKNTLVKRHKQGSTSSSNAECSRSTADDSDIMFFGSLGQTTNSRLTENQNHNGVRITESVIDIDEASPEVRRVRSRGIGCSGGSEDATATQVELDEMLARELQEQFYNEDPAVGSGEIDAHMALALQQEEESHHAVSRRRQPVRNPGGRSYPNLPRTGARAPSSSRITRLRSRFPGQPRTLVPSRGRNSTILPAREGNSLFPTDMDVDMRMHILEALESFSGMVDSSFLQMHRDFNENDYESLLALDENNHQHTGATTRQITGLPQSTVQSNNLEEACAICLENPTVGDIIRHLPCLHKFHKDCIDPWLRRRTSCPVCKSSIT